MAIRNLKITVVDGGKSSRKSSSKSGDGESKKNAKNSPLYKVLNAKDTIKDKLQSGMSSSTVFAMNMGLRVAGQVVRQTANYYVSDIGRKNGDSNYQAMINRQIEVVSDTVSVVGGALSGAATGAMFGPIGAAVGAVVGTASSAISLGFKYAEREREYQHTMFEEHNNQAYNLSRANFNALSGRVR